MSGDLTELREIVAADPQLEGRLMAHRDWVSFSDEVLAIATAHGLRVPPDAISAAARDGQPAWNERWLS